MGIKIKAIKNWKNTKIGDVFECSKKSAENYISQGYAKYIQKENQPIKNNNPKTTIESPKSKTPKTPFTIENEENLKLKWSFFKKQKSKQGIEALKHQFKNWSENRIYNMSIVLYFLYFIENIETILIKETIETIDKLKIKDNILLCSFLPSKISEIQKAMEKSSIGGINNYIKGEKGKAGLLDQRMLQLVNEEKKHYQITKEGQSHIYSIFKTLIDLRKQKEEEEKDQKEREDKTSNFIEKFKEFIEKELKTQENQEISINFKKLIRFNHLAGEYLLEKPTECFKIIEIAIKDLFQKHKPFIIINIPNTELVKIGEIRHKHLNKLIKVRGNVSSLSDVKPKITTTKFECPQCATTINFLQQEDKLKEPSKCGCGFKGKFRLVDKSLVDIQKMILEELSEELDGRTEARKLKVVLKDNLTKYDLQPQFESSSKLELIGILQEMNIEKKGNKQSELDFFLEVSSINTDGWKELRITPQEKEEIEKISKSPKLINKLVENVAPHIAGLEFEKTGMLISIVSGGDPKKTVKGKRDDVHLLFVGDPSVGKSQLMQFGNKIYPKSRWVSGNSTTGVGLIGSVVHDDFLNQPTVSKGALALANRHVVFLDELDKMRDQDKDALHNAMEDQFATIHKWNKHTKFQTDTTIIAAMNPIQSKFHDDDEVHKQIELAQTIMDRFDLIFVIRDLIDSDKDKELVKKILEEHNKESTGDIDNDLFMKYIDYARSFRPILSKESQELIEEEYLKLRKQYPTVMTPRQLMGLIRITLAISKLKLKNNTTEADTHMAINLVRYCLAQQWILDEQIKITFEDLEG